MRRCADQIDCGYDNRDSDHFCRACALPLLGTVLAGRYVVEALISKGGYAVVFRGVDSNLSRRIAIKVLLPSKTTAAEQEHFLREARIAATLDHPNIVPVLDYGQDGPSVFLVMPLYTAGSLRTRLAQVSGPLSLPETSHHFRQLAQALYYAHTRPRPIIHRDIKPENILLHQDDHRVVITDFGIARILEPGALFGRTVTVRGTIGYMAPEQTSGIVDPRSDQYGSAVVLYEMLTGYHPLDGANIPPPSVLNNELPTALDSVVLRALAPHPESRYADMFEFQRAFEYMSQPTGQVRLPAHNQQTSPEMRTMPTGQNSAVSSMAAADLADTDKSRILREGSVSSGGNTPYPHRISPSRVQQSNTSSIREKCREADELLKHNLYSQALNIYEEVLRIDPRNFHAWNGKGTVLYKRGNYRKALDAYQRAIDIDPDDPVVWFSAGLVLNRLQRYQQALVHFERGLSLDPQYVAAWNGKAEAQLALNLPEDALSSYEQALGYEPDSFQAWNGLGNAHTYLHDFSGAVDAYTRALLINSRSAVAWCNKADALLHLGHTRAALDALNEATAMDNSYGRAWEMKAEIYQALGNVQEAQKARKRARSWGARS